MTRPSLPARSTRDGARRRWPLLAIGASAGTATWSGWVGLGQLTGFGVVHPLPGIADGFTINTAVTLPIGVEAYAMYALSIATSARPLDRRTRRYAWASSAAALLLGMAGQVAYHVMTAGHTTPAPGSQLQELAPWQVIALVSCLPVLVLGAASLLWHLAGTGTGQDDPPAGQHADAADDATGTGPDPAGLRPARPEDLARLRDAITPARPVPDPAPGGVPPVVTDPVPVPVPVPDPLAVPSPDPVPVALAVPSTSMSAHDGPVSAVMPLHVVGNGRSAVHEVARSAVRSQRLHGTRAARPDDVARLRKARTDGVWPALPTVREIRDHLSIGTDHAAAARRVIAARHPSTPDHEDKEQPETPEQHPQEKPEPLAEESNSTVSKKASQ